MDGSSYIDIFDTKGIEYIVIIAFLVLIIPFWRALNKPIKAGKLVREAAGTLSEGSLNIPQGVFFGRNHTWTYLEKSGISRIGLNDLILHLTGPVEITFEKQPGEKIEKGQILAEISQDGKKLKIESPLTGKIEKINSRLKEDPVSLLADPYGKGWLAAVKAKNWRDETHALLLSEDATKWIREELSELKDFFALEVKKYSPDGSQLILQEGGELRDFPLSEMNNEVWNEFQEKFLSRK